MSKKDGWLLIMISILGSIMLVYGEWLTKLLDDQFDLIGSLIRIVIYAFLFLAFVIVGIKASHASR